ncbi:putative keratin-associated protein 4-16 [Pseudopipra pipra]|uniref:putative keratin-associated protein 4-16 n=1 Tax=Pseudopipra pipra TaxID=415032 RepID=UPI0031387F8A
MSGNGFRLTERREEGVQDYKRSPGPARFIRSSSPPFTSPHSSTGFANSPTNKMPNGGCGCCGGGSYSLTCYSTPSCCKTPMCCSPMQCCSPCCMPVQSCCMPMSCCYTISNNNRGCCGGCCGGN